MSNSNVLNLMGDKMDKPVIELRPIFEQQQLLEKEKRSITRLWKAREKHIQNSVNGASMLAGQLETILGASVVNQIGFEKFDVLEIIEDEEKDND